MLRPSYSREQNPTDEHAQLGIDYATPGESSVNNICRATRINQPLLVYCDAGPSEIRDELT
jgi:hypothetical protein